MFSNLFWVFAVAGFVAQILCCIFGKNRLTRLLPMVIVGLIMVCTVVFGSMGIVSMILLGVEFLLLAVLALAYGLCKLVLFTKK